MHLMDRDDRFPFVCATCVRAFSIVADRFGAKALRLFAGGLLLLSLSACMSPPSGGGGDATSLSCTAEAVTSNGLETPFSFGSSGGCITSITAEHEAEAAALRASDPYTTQILGFTFESENYTSFSLSAGRFEYAHALDLRGAGELIAIRDNGFHVNHVEFADKNLFYGDGIDGSTITDADHGTAVAALAAGAATSGLTLGAAPSADLLLSSWDDESETAAVLKAIELGAIAQNNSWAWVCEDQTHNECGVNDVAPTDKLYQSYINALRDYAGDVGVVVFAASNTSSQTQSTVMAALPGTYSDLEEGWLTVINLSRDYDETEPTLFNDNNVIRWSSGCLEAAKWCVALDGYSYVAISGSGNDYQVGDGTSYAAPRVSGAIAILSEAFPNLTAKELRNRLLLTSDNAFFAGDVANIQTMTFNEGLTHDYHWEYGHGFVDLRAALLPIGTFYTSSSEGQRYSLDGGALYSSSGAAGDSLRQTLKDVRFTAQDQAGGTFDSRADQIVVASAQGNLSRTAIRSLMQPDDDQMAVPDAELSAPFNMTAGKIIPLDLPRGYQLDLLVPDDGTSAQGLKLARNIQRGNTGIHFGVSAFQEEGSVLGVSSLDQSAPIQAKTFGVDFGLTRYISEDFAVSLGGHFGGGIAQADGLIHGFENLGFDGLGAEIRLSNALAQDDHLTLFLRRPAAITSGAAYMTLASGLSETGKLEYADYEIPLAPEARETDVGFEYRSALPGQAEFFLSASHALNSGHSSGAKDSSASVGFDIRF